MSDERMGAMHDTRLEMVLLVSAILLILNLTAAIATTLPPNEISYVWGMAYHILPETHNNESGYVSLCEGKNGKVYIGTAKYGENAYLVEFDPTSGLQRIVVDVNQVTGATGRGYAAQSKIHTPNYVGSSGKIYFGSKQGYPSTEDIANNVCYPGGYVMVYDPATGKTDNLGMPYPGQGVIDVVADEKRGLIYIVTCEEGHWMLYNVNTKSYRELAPRLPSFMTTLVDAHGRAHVITRDLHLATYDPRTDRVTIHPIQVEGGGASFATYPPNGILAHDGKTAYFTSLSDPSLYVMDLSSRKPVMRMHNLGPMLEGQKCDSRGSLCQGPDGGIYRVMRTDTVTRAGSKPLHHVVRYHPKSRRMEDLGVLAVLNPRFCGLSLESGRNVFNPMTGKECPWTNGFQWLPDGILTPQLYHMAGRVAHDGTLYVTFLYPFTLLRVESSAFRK